MEDLFVYGKNVRCRVSYVKHMGNFELRIQRLFWLGYLSTDFWMTVKEGFWGDGWGDGILKTSYSCGHNAEAYKTGTLNIRERAEQFILEYDAAEFKKTQAIERAKKQLT